MKSSLGKDFLVKRLVTVQVVAFLAVIVLLWLDELIDLPHLLFGAAATPVNWLESLLETLYVVPVGLGTVYYTRLVVKRLKHLEGFLPICASCKRIRDRNGDWQPVESYIREQSEAEFSHGICPECARTLYGDLLAARVEPDKPSPPGRHGE